MQIIGETLHVQDAYNFVIYHLGVGAIAYYLCVGLPEPQWDNIVYSFHAFLYMHGSLSIG